MRVLARQDYVIAYPGESVDWSHRDMMLKYVECIVVVESRWPMEPIAAVRANGILRLRR